MLRRRSTASREKLAPPLKAARQEGAGQGGLPGWDGKRHAGLFELVVQRVLNARQRARPLTGITLTRQGPVNGYDQGKLIKDVFPKPAATSGISTMISPFCSGGRVTLQGP